MTVQSLDVHPVLEAYDCYRDCLGVADRYREDIGVSPKSHHAVDVVQAHAKLLSSLESALSPFRRDDIRRDILDSIGNAPYGRADVYTLASQGESRVLISRNSHHGWSGSTPMPSMDHHSFSCVVAPDSVPISDLLNLAVLTHAGSRPCPYSMMGAKIGASAYFSAISLLTSSAFFCAGVSVDALLRGTSGSFQSLSNSVEVQVMIGGIGALFLGTTAWMLDGIRRARNVPEYRLARADSLSERVEGFDGALMFLGVKPDSV